MRGTLSSASGFTVVEVVVSVTLLAVVLLATSGLFLFSFTQSGISRSYTDAALVANEALEILRGMRFGDLPAGISACFPDRTLNGRTYSCTRDISPGQPAANLTSILVTVSWSAGGVDRNYLVRTIFSDVER